MKVDPVTGAIPVKFGDEIIELRFTNSAFAYLEDEANVDSAQDAIARLADGMVNGKIVFSMVIAFGRAFLRAAKKDPDLVDAVNRGELIEAVTALTLSVIEANTGDANPQTAAGQN